MGGDFYYGKATSLIYEVGCKVTTHEHFYKKFFSQVNLNITSESKILDAGCGGGRLTISLLTEYARKREIHPEIHAFDISDDILKHAEDSAARNNVRRDIRLYQADAQDLTKVRWFKHGITHLEELKFKDEAFDVVMASGLLECVPEPELAVREMMRVLKPGGKLIISFVSNNLLGKCASIMWHFTPLDHEYILSRFKEIDEFMEFKVKTFNPYMKTLKRIYIGTKK